MFCLCENNFTKKYSRWKLLQLFNYFGSGSKISLSFWIVMESSNLFIAKILSNAVSYYLTSQKHLGPTGSRTQVAGFKVQSANHYTMEPICQACPIMHFNSLMFHFPSAYDYFFPCSKMHMIIRVLHFSKNMVNLNVTAEKCTRK